MGFDKIKFLGFRLAPLLMVVVKKISFISVNRFIQRSVTESSILGAVPTMHQSTRTGLSKRSKWSQAALVHRTVEM